MTAIDRLRRPNPFIHMVRPRVLVLRAPGTNCDEETAHAFSLAGGVPERWHINRLLEEPARVADYQVLCVPGGFSYGDDIAAGRILGNQIEHHLAGRAGRVSCSRQVDSGCLQWISNLVEDELARCRRMTMARLRRLTLNDSGRFEARWVRLDVEPGKLRVPATASDEMELPVAHAEGKFVVRDASFLRTCKRAGDS